MKSLELESWALRILERIENHQPIEDSRVELKSMWPDDFPKTARQLAGHANAARGEPLLWLVGADEEKGIVGANAQELSDWCAKVQAPFESLYPALETTLNVPHKDKTVVTLCFDTSRFPYVVRNPCFGKPDGGPVKFEVPWREGNSTRSAVRSDLVLMLSPLIRLPKVEILEGTIHRFAPNATGIKPYLLVSLKVYVAYRDDVPLTFPFHRCQATVLADNTTIADGFAVSAKLPPKPFTLSTLFPHRSSPSRAEISVRTGGEIIEATEREIIVRGSGQVEIEGSMVKHDWQQWPELRLLLTLAEAVSGDRVALAGRFLRDETQRNEFVWKLRP